MNQRISLVPSRRVLMGSNWIEQPLPAPEVDRIGPFLLIHHWQDLLPGGQKQLEVGVGPHPHRGFSPVTCIYSGAIRHRDSLGNDHVVQAGGTQWMDSGSGIVHSERPDAALAETGGLLEIIQFWINTPRAHKMSKPAYHPLTAEDTPTWEDGGWTVSLVHGEWNGNRSPIAATHPLRIANLTGEPGDQTTVPLPSGWVGALYVLDGSITLGGHTAMGKQMLVIDSVNLDEELELACVDRARVLFLSGGPFNEPVVTHGPFVMSTPMEINEAIRDYQTGKMGRLIEN
jgi:redox-sensitive bicupin YhaK (pirin superfamily)